MIRFGTGGWRAVIGQDFTEENVRKVGAGIAQWLTATYRKKTVFIGYDRRMWSKEASEWLADTLSHAGIEVLVSNTYISSPAAMYYVQSNNLDCGLMVTASHNPPEYNGIKVFIKEGRDAPVNITRDIEGCIESPCSVSDVVLPVRYISVIADFASYIRSKLNIERNTELRIAFDAMFGSAKEPFVTIAAEQGLVTVINDGVRPADRKGLPAPDKENINELLSMVPGVYDIGFAFDGDGDRIGIVDDTGEYISANEAICIMYWYLHECRKETGCAVKNLCTTERLKAIAHDFGEECYDVPVGFKWISAKMKETHALIGGESSGGMTFRNYINGKDATLTAMLFIEMLANTGRKLSDIKNQLRTKYKPSAFIVDSTTYLAEKRSAIESFLGHDIAGLYADVDRVDYMDGCKVVFKNGDFLSCRFSGTEPLVRFMAESDSDALAQGYIDTCKQAFANI